MSDYSNKNILTLLQLTQSIQNTIAESFKSPFWIKAEMNKLNYYERSGHCYPDLVEKQNGKVVVQIRSNLWKADYWKINAKFQRILKEPLKDGIKILFLATVKYHPQYGLSLQIIDIDPSYTLGDLEREKQETLNRLKIEGVFNQNKQLKLPKLPQRIAIISVQTSNGYADFIQVMQEAESNWNYCFFQMLFPSLLQGDEAAKMIIQQLRKIEKVKQHFDVVAIIRGGGGDVGLSCYNNYNLANEIAQFPIPVITGIGHSTNETVAELIAYENAITPTKLAEMLIQKYHNFSIPVNEAKDKIIDQSKRLINNEKSNISSEVKSLELLAQNILIQNKNDVDHLMKSLIQQSNFRLINEDEMLSRSIEKIKKGNDHRCSTERQAINHLKNSLKKDVLRIINHQSILLDHKEKNIKNLSPINVLKRGYSITRSMGNLVTSSAQIKKGEEIETTLFDGKVISTVKSTNKQIENE